MCNDKRVEGDNLIEYIKDIYRVKKFEGDFYVDDSINHTKSPHDTCAYRYVQLRNGVSGLLIHDPTTEKASAALNVRVGSFHDPTSVPGMAHFLEHLLFMGTAKYPEENGFLDFLNAHGGQSNAYTQDENTNYYFEVHHAYLGPSVDRFSQFFINPLFNESCTEREREAVDSENKKNLQNDAWRLQQLERSLSNPLHPYHYFSTGNRETLSGASIRASIIQFYNDQYDGRLMKACIYGREALDELERLFVEQFSLIKTKYHEQETHFVIPSWIHESLLQEEHYLKKVSMQSLKDKKTLKIEWRLPDLRAYYTCQATSYLSFLIGHEGPGSIFSVLRKKGWANSLSAGVETAMIGHEIFLVSVKLTIEGLEKIGDIMVLIFQYIRLIKKNGICENIFKELKELEEMRWMFAEKPAPSNIVNHFTNALHNFPVKDILKTSLYQEWNPELVYSVLETLNPERFRMFLIHNNPESPCDCTEPWYGTKYSTEMIESSLIELLKLDTFSPDLHLPRSNEFIPRNFDLRGIKTSEPLQQPCLIYHKDENYRFWHKLDDNFMLPKAHIKLLLIDPQLSQDIEYFVRFSLWISLLQDELNELLYDANNAGLRYSFEVTSKGLQISVAGYNDTLTKLLVYLIRQLKTFVPSMDRFHIIKELSEKVYENFERDSPYQHATYFLVYALAEGQFSNGEKLAVLKKIQFDHVSCFKFDENLSFLETLMMGNLSHQEAMELSLQVVQLLPMMISDYQSSTPNLRIVKVPTRCDPPLLFLRSTMDNNNATLCYYQLHETDDLDANTKTSLLDQVLNERFFDYLRTKEQLGYLVNCTAYPLKNVFGMLFLIQSAQYSCQFLFDRIQAFIAAVSQYLKNELTLQEFDTFREALKHVLLQKSRSLAEESKDYWEKIFSNSYDYLRHRKKAETLNTLTKDDLVNFWDKDMVTNSKNFNVFILRQGDPIERTQYALLDQDTVQQWKRSLDHHDLQKPTVPLTQYKAK